jgi:hypothetical protein
VAPTLPLPRAPQASNSTEEVLSQLGHRHSGTLAAGAPLPSVAETGPSSAGAESEQPESAASGQQARAPKADQKQQAEQQAEPRQQPDSQAAFSQPKGLNIRAQQQAASRRESTQAWQSLHTAPPQLPPAQQQASAAGAGAPGQPQQQQQRQQQQQQQDKQGQDQQRGQQQGQQQRRHRASAEASAAEASALFGTQSSGMRQRQTSDEHRRGDVAELSSYGWLSTGGGGGDDSPAGTAQTAAAKANGAGEVRLDFQDEQQLGRSHSGAALKAYSSGGSAGGGGGRRISRDSDRCAR